MRAAREGCERPMTTDADDRSTWPRNGQVIRRDELLRLIEENGNTWGLDLRGAVFVGDGPSIDPSSDPIDLSREALAPLAERHRKTKGGSNPPWTAGRAMNLTGAELQGAFFLGAHLQGAALVGAHLQGTALAHAHLQGANLRGALLENADLSLAHLQNADLRRTRLEGVMWYSALLDRTHLRREQLGPAIGDEIRAHRDNAPEHYHRAKEAYLLLKNNFNQIGRYEDASWAYVKEQQMEKIAYCREWRSHGWRFWRWRSALWRWLLAWGTEALTKYGQDPWRPVFWAVGLAVGLFPLLFWLAGNLHYQNGAPITAYWDAIAYSLTTFGTLSFNELQPVGIGTRIISAMEAFTGVLLFALLVFTLGNKMSRG